MINIWSKILCFRHLSKEIHILNDNKTGWWCSSTNPLMVENIKSLIQLTFQLFSSFSVGLNVYQWSHTERINGAKNRFKLLNGYREANDRKTSDIVIRDYWLYCWSMRSLLYRKIMHKSHFGHFFNGEKSLYNKNKSKVQIAFTFDLPLVGRRFFGISRENQKNFEYFENFECF